jgi:hypothetical protein
MVLQVRAPDATFTQFPELLKRETIPNALKARIRSGSWTCHYDWFVLATYYPDRIGVRFDAPAPPAA